MGKPIKISDQLYQRLKSQADSQGLTLQDALVELITTPHEGLAELQSQLEAARKTVASQREYQLSQRAELQKLRSEVGSLRSQINELIKQRGKDIEALKGWVDVWEEIPSLAQRVGALERLKHQHFWQDVDED